MHNDVKQQLRNIYAQIPDKKFFEKLLLLCKIFSVSNVKLIPKE